MNTPFKNCLSCSSIWGWALPKMQEESKVEGIGLSKKTKE